MSLPAWLTPRPRSFRFLRAVLVELRGIRLALERLAEHLEGPPRVGPLSQETKPPGLPIIDRRHPGHTGFMTGQPDGVDRSGVFAMTYEDHQRIAASTERLTKVLGREPSEQELLADLGWVEDPASLR